MVKSDYYIATNFVTHTHRTILLGSLYPSAYGIRYITLIEVSSASRILVQKSGGNRVLRTVRSEEH